MKINYKKIFKYIILFIFFFVCINFIYINYYSVDLNPNFSFSYAILRGEVPYRDFNMVVPPFSAFLYAIPLFLFGNDLLVYNLFQSFLLCILFFFLFKLFDKKAYLFLLIMILFMPLPFTTILYGGYNFLLVLELVLLIYLEKTDKSDILIGVVLAISILTKQTVGFFFLLVSLYYLVKDKRKVFRRVIGFLIPCFIFLIYLLCSNSFFQFIDLCLFGLIDFSNSNGFLFDYYILIFIVELILVLIMIYKDKNNISNYYVLAFMSIVLPIFDLYHITLALFAFFILVIDKIDIKYNSFVFAFNTYLFSIFVIVIFSLLTTDYNCKVSFVSYNHYKWHFISNDSVKNINEVNAYIEKNKDKNIIFLDSNALFFKIINNFDTNYYDILYYGNHGYNGTSKVIEMIQEEDEPIFIIDISKYNNNSNKRDQMNKEVIKYVLDNYEKSDSIGSYDIYS